MEVFASYLLVTKKVSWEDTWAFDIQDGKSKNTLLAFHFRLSSTLSPKTKMEKEHMSGVSYVNIVESIINDVMVYTHPDISHIINMVNKFVENLGKLH